MNNFAICTAGMFLARKAETCIQGSWRSHKIQLKLRLDFLAVAFTYQDKLRVIPAHLYDWRARVPSHILHCSSSRSLDRHNKLQCNKTKSSAKCRVSETNSLYIDFCSVEHKLKKNISMPPLFPLNNHAANKFFLKQQSTQEVHGQTSCTSGVRMPWL